MGKGRVRVKGAKGKRWRKGQSGCSNPEANKHRTAARGKFGGHLSQVQAARPGLPLTTETLASHDAIHEEQVESASSHEEEFTHHSAASSSAYSLIDTAHPVFDKVKRLWNSPLESHREVCAVLAAVSEVVKTHDGKDTKTEYFASLMTALESAEEEKPMTAIAYLLNLIMTKVPSEVLQTRYAVICKVIVDKLTAFEMSDSTALQKSLVACLSALLVAQGPSVWEMGNTQRVFQTLLNFTVHPKPKLRKAAHAGVVSLLREGTTAGGFHPSTGLVAQHCRHVIEKGGGETSVLHVLVMLKDCLANFQTQQLKSLCEAVLKLLAMGNTMIRTTAFHTLHGLFTSLAGPQGLTAQLNGQLISALYDYQPSLVDAQLLQAWLTVMQSAHSNLARMDLELCLAHLPRLFSICISCFLSDKTIVTETAANTIQVELKDCITPFLETVDDEKSHKEKEEKRRMMKTKMENVQKSFRAVEMGLKYKYFSSWASVLKVLRSFYLAAGKKGHKFMTNSLVSLCELRSTESFPYCAELDSAFGAAIRTMGPRVVLKAVPLQLDIESSPPDFTRSWVLPVLRDHVMETELAYFTDSLLPLAGQIRTKSQQFKEAGKEVEAKLLDTLQSQIWSLLPGFCTNPVDLVRSFRGIARILGTALSQRPDLRTTICRSLQVLTERNRENEGNRSELARFAKNFLPILFNIYTLESQPKNAPQAPVLECVRTYISIADQQLVTSLFNRALEKLQQEEIPPSVKNLIFDILHTLVPYLTLSSLNQLFQFISPLLENLDSSLQKKAYSSLEHMLSCDSHIHLAFQQDHLKELRSLLLDSLSTASTAAKKPRLKCLLCLVDSLMPEGADFLSAITPEVILCSKEVNERVRTLTQQVLVRIGYAAQRCYGKSAEEAMKEYFLLVLAGLAGSAHMVSATLICLSRLVYEFHDLLATEMIKTLLSTACVLLSSNTREVVKATLTFIKVIIGTLPPTELAPHLEDLVSSVLNWSGNHKSHFRLKSRVILERLMRKFSHELISSLVPEKHHKLVVHIRKTIQRQKRQKLARTSRDKEEDKEEDRKKLSKPSYEELLYDSSDEEEGGKTRSMKESGSRKKREGTWIKEGSEDEPVNFLDPQVVKHVIATNPSAMSYKRKLYNPFLTTPEGKLIIGEEESGSDQAAAIAAANDDGGDDDMDITVKEDTRMRRKRKIEETTEGEEDSRSGTRGGGIHRKNPSRMDFDYGSEYKAKKAKGDVKKPGRPDPYAYVPMMRQKLNRRKRAKLAGQFTGLMKRAKRGSSIGTKQMKRRRK